MGKGGWGVGTALYISMCIACNVKVSERWEREDKSNNNDRTVRFSKMFQCSTRPVLRRSKFCFQALLQSFSRYGMISSVCLGPMYDVHALHV